MAAAWPRWQVGAQLAAGPCWPLATEMQMLVAARHRWPGTSQALGRGSRYRQICLIGAQWCRMPARAAQPGDTQELGRCQERGE